MKEKEEAADDNQPFADQKTGMSFPSYNYRNVDNLKREAKAGKLPNKLSIFMQERQTIT